MRWITCYVTKEKGNSDEYYYAPDGHYYKTKELYDKRMHDKDVSKEIIQFINQKILCSAHSQMHGILSSQYLKMMENLPATTLRILVKKKL